MTVHPNMSAKSGFPGWPSRLRAARWMAVSACIVWTLPLALDASAASAGSGQMGASRPSPLHLAISNYQYCRQAPCRYPTDAAYRRTTSGPVAGTDNPSKFVAVSPGQAIIWTYEDTATGGPASCDFYGTPPYPSDPSFACIGHAVSLENDTADGTAIGYELPARQGRQTVSWTVPLDAKPGSLIRYFCAVRDGYVPGGLPHWFYGMTGGLIVMNPSAE
jgi:hypothetical protein